MRNEGLQTDIFLLTYQEATPSATFVFFNRNSFPCQEAASSPAFKIVL